MYIYLVTRTDAPDYDEYGGVVLVAKSPARALEMATERAVVVDILPSVPRYRGFRPDGSNLVVSLIGFAQRDAHEREILASFRAG